MDEDCTILLIDESGKEIKFIFLDLIQYKDNEYVVLLKDNVDELAILLVDSINTESESFFSVSDKETLRAVLDIFRKNVKNVLDLEDWETLK